MNTHTDARVDEAGPADGPAHGQAHGPADGPGGGTAHGPAGGSAGGSAVGPAGGSAVGPAGGSAGGPAHGPAHGPAGGSAVGQLVRAIAGGSEAAWNELVRRYSPLVMAVARSHHLGAEDARDVCQTVWLRLVEHLRNLREPDALPLWLMTTTRHECSRQARRGRRLVPADLRDETAQQEHLAAPSLDAEILAAELRQAVRDGLGQLPARDQRLLELRASDPPAPYREISLLLDMPIGSIGPTLRRSLERLRETGAVQAYLAA
jgi:RNA polymerase sigma factor (sigma-70 family)